VALSSFLPSLPPALFPAPAHSRLGERSSPRIIHEATLIAQRAKFPYLFAINRPLLFPRAGREEGGRERMREFDCDKAKFLAATVRNCGGRSAVSIAPGRRMGIRTRSE